YGLNEVTNPVRVVTSTVKVEGGELPVIPVKTNGAIPKPLNFECMKVINETVIKAPVKMGDIVIKDVLGTGIDVIASRNIEAV
ncbi:DUF1667 domain-containing protein, partial [Clostridium sp.]|uniref:DUF1667 domain-containing protein n=1 Tax=Clostridium sp. TaxID=1506 RepID=UPI0026DA94E4